MGNEETEEIKKSKKEETGISAKIKRYAPRAVITGGALASLYLLYNLLRGPIGAAYGLYRGARALYDFFRDPYGALLRKLLPSGPPSWKKGGLGSGGGRGDFE